MHLVPLLLLLSACAFIGDEHAKWREDPDGDGVIVGSDCDDADGAVGGPSTFYADADADGYGDLASPTSACAAPAGTVVDATDCDDANAAFHPGADETDCADSHDYNCDGSVGGADADADGYVACQDCDDADGDVNPAANEICNDLDDDCDGGVDLGVPDAPTWYQDADGDGFGDPAIAIVACAQPGLYVEDATDCEDDSSEINPGAEERCNTLDDDCDGEIDADAIDAALWYLDADGDGYGTEGAAVASCDALAGYSSLSDDCDDTDARYNPGAAESDCTDANDYNCDGSTGLIDDDGDGYAACVECDDGDSEIHPGATERCDAADNDCDGTVDEDDAVDASTWYGDADADGYGGATPTAACDRPTGTLATSTDCDDADSSIHPGGVEVCDADDTDEDCDGAADEAGAAGEASWYPDADGDGYGSTRATEACEQPAGHVTNADDCDDGDAAYNPGASEEDCTDPSDYNCDGFTGAVDLDGDGYVSCEDCNDGDADVNPDAIEVCDGVDNDCDGDADSGAVDGIDWYEDSDGDGYGSAVVATACDAPPSHVALDGDCDDTTGAVNPDATERCDAADADENCDGLADDASATGHTSWYADADADGYGAGVGTSACDAPASSVANATDCDDASSTDYPGATETVANSDDEDCDGVDSCYTDADGDNYGTTVVVDGSTLDCSTGTGAPVSTDCNDTSATINPGATELTADSIDQDCDGVDSCYRDADGDNYGTTVVVDGSTLSCVTGVGAPVSTDCNDASATINPGATELAADSIDQDCDTVDSCYTDADGDNYGTTVVVDGSSLSCTTGTGAPVSTDCDDTSAAISPADAEITADGIDQDCDTVDSCYTDADGDNYGTTVVVDGSTLSCTTGTGAPVSTDCDDASSTDYPGATETVANSDDEDCDGVDSCYTDADGDNHGTTVVVDGSTLNCTTGTGAPASTDCDDSDADTFPGSAALELITSCTNDDDNDGYGDQTVSALYVEGTDCNDASSSISPDDTEVCDNFIDDDCDGGAGGCALSGGNLGGADVKFTGETGSEYAFSWVSGAGDIDDDGYDDVIVGASGNDEGGVDAGAAYLLLGGATPASRSLALADAQYTGEAAGDSAGASASGAGDFNGDGYDDLIINAKSNDDGPGVDAGASYLVLGRATPTSGGLSAATAQYTGEAASDAAGESGAGAGDFNADGYDDLIIGAAANDDGGLSAGAAYLVLGRATPASWGLSSANAQYTGESAGDQAGTAVSGAGDVDADGYDDLIVGANANDDGGANAGAAYLVLGGTTPASLVLASADAQYAGEAAGDFAGGSVSGAGDFNADGYDDLLVGADQNDEGGTRAGAAYLVLGGATPASRSLSSANAQYTGVGGDDNAGTSVSGVGDVDGDSYDDLIIGADGTCAVYLVLGGSVVSSLSLSSADLTYTGESTADLAGSSVSGAGDFDDDGFSDFLIGDWQNGTTGAAYLILGGGL